LAGLVISFTSLYDEKRARVDKHRKDPIRGGAEHRWEKDVPSMLQRVVPINFDGLWKYPNTYFSRYSGKKFIWEDLSVPEQKMFNYEQEVELRGVCSPTDRGLAAPKWRAA
jgi:hypothetical protein